MATEVFYGEVYMKNVMTREWDESVEYDQSSTDSVTHRFAMRFDGIVHVQGTGDQTIPAWVGNYFNQAFGTTAAEQEEWIRCRLKKPRQELRIDHNGVTILRCVPSLTQARLSDVDRDVSNGPHPRGVMLSKIAGNQVYSISFSIEVAKVECCNGQPPPLVLSNRWSIQETLDDNFFTTKTIRGRVRFSQSNVHPNHAFKNTVVPHLEAGFKRSSIDFILEESGLTADYTVTDTQITTAAPYPATSISGRYTESTGEGGVFCYSDIALRLDGDPHTDRGELLFRAVQLAMTRIPLAEMNDKLELESASITEFVGAENAVEFQCRVRRKYDANIDFLTGLRTDAFGKPYDAPASPFGFATDSRLSRVPIVWGYPTQTLGNRNLAALWLQHCYLQSACQADHCIEKGNFIPADDPCDQHLQRDNPSGSVIVVQQLPQIPPPFQNQATLTEPGVFTFATMQNRYLTKPVRAQLPIARSSNPATPSQTIPTAIGASLDDTSVVVDLAPPQATREIIYEAEKTGSWPEVPTPLDRYVDDNGVRYTLLEFDPQPITPPPTADGKSLLYRILVKYRYALSRPLTLSEKMAVGSLPFTNIQAGTPQSSFVPADRARTRLLGVSNQLQ